MPWIHKECCLCQPCWNVQELCRDCRVFFQFTVCALEGFRAVLWIVLNKVRLGGEELVRVVNSQNVFPYLSSCGGGCLLRCHFSLNNLHKLGFLTGFFFESALV